MVLEVAREEIVLEVSTVDTVAEMLRDGSDMIGQIEVISPSTILLNGMNIRRYFAVITRLEVEMSSHGARIKFAKFAKAVAIGIPRRSVASLTIEHGSHSIVGGDEGGIHTKVIVGAAHTGKRYGLIDGKTIAIRLLGNNVDHTANSRRAKKSRTSTAYHLHAVYHVGGNLLNTVHAG